MVAYCERLPSSLLRTSCTKQIFIADEFIVLFLVFCVLFLFRDTLADHFISSPFLVWINLSPRNGLPLRSPLGID